MPSIFLAPYSFTISKKRSNKPETFSNVSASIGILKLVENYLDGLNSTFTDDTDSSSIFRVSHKIVDAPAKCIHGIIEAGEYGIESQFYDKTGIHKFNRLKDHAEVMPFYFLLYLNPKSQVGIIVLQRFGQYGITKTFNNGLISYFKQLYPNYVYKIEPIVSTKVLHKILDEGEIRKATFTRFTIPSELDKWFKRNKGNQTGYMELSMIARKNSQLAIKEKLKKVMLGTSRRDSLLKINNFPYDEMKVTIQHGHRTRTISLDDRAFRPYYDVTRDVIKDTNGHPNFLSMRQTASDLLIELNDML